MNPALPHLPAAYDAPSVQDFWQPFVGNGAFAFTRPTLEFIVVAIILAVGMLVLTRKLALVPSKGQFVTESVYALVRNGVGRDVIGSAEFLRWVPLLFALFLTILLNNLMGVVPVAQFPTFARFGFDVALSLVVYVVYQVVAIRRRGVFGYLRSLVPPGLPLWVRPLVFLLEFITYFVTRPVTLALRLFGNMFAGHLILLLFSTGGEYLLLHSHGPTRGVGVVSYLLYVVMFVFEILVEVLQAYVFVLLTALYIAGSLADEH